MQSFDILACTHFNVSVLHCLGRHSRYPKKLKYETSLIIIIMAVNVQRGHLKKQHKKHMWTAPIHYKQTVKNTR